MKIFFSNIVFLSILLVIFGSLVSFPIVFAGDENDVSKIQLQYEYPGLSTTGKKICAGSRGLAKEIECKTNQDCIDAKYELCVGKLYLETDNNKDPGAALSVFLNNFYKLAIVIAAMAAVLMLVVGGYKWIFAGGNSSVVDSAKKTIKGAILGLVIALLSYSILQIVNPNTLDVSISKHLSSVDRIDQFVGGANTSYIARCLPEFNVQATGTGELS
ncbi:MAG: hypothetical protein HN991_04290, partial [Candidatus Jacksonbacteria bacterium]|nr:hypothetical protein [Candidatus Jacksonbacteria bacterium]